MNDRIRYREPGGRDAILAIKLTRPCTDKTCDHPLRVIVPAYSTKIVRTIPCSWVVSA